ncbi:alginate lyase family protein [Botrimarina hoheduenensis]|uniref:alginate lyase family protein n=1 Tax=Botrimarina hoheduenensis TaxID=2528000 RepID=UPI0018D398E4|nr:alginate lyase family protein [Botrimarina hoheduenensis]
MAVVASTPASPATTYWDGAHLARLRAGDPKADARTTASLEQVHEKARSALKRGPYSVVDKTLVPPSGDKHDYASYGRYWWPNPDTNDGLPYVRRDGKVNRAMLSAGDRVRLADFCDDLEALALGAYVHTDSRYAEHGANLVRVWFLDEATRMRPRIRFGQAVPGRSEGRGAGVLDARNFIRVIDSITLLEAMDAFSRDEQAALREWFREYAEWLATSPIAAEERQADNNHGTWFAAQEGHIALFNGDAVLARKIVEQARDKRFPRSITPEGTQPEELTRTQSLHYCFFNLEAFFSLARVGDRVGVDLWNYTAPSGASLRKAFDWVSPYPAKQKAWSYPMLDRYSVSDAQSTLFIMAAQKWQNPRYLRLLDKAPGRYQERHLAPLMFPSYATEDAL